MREYNPDDMMKKMPKNYMTKGGPNYMDGEFRKKDYSSLYSKKPLKFTPELKQFDGDVMRNATRAKKPLGKAIKSAIHKGARMLAKGAKNFRNPRVGMALGLGAAAEAAYGYFKQKKAARGGR